MELLALTRIVMWQGGSLWVVDATRPSRPQRQTDTHAHHAIQITFGLGGSFRFVSEGRSFDGEGVAVAPDAPHAFEAEGLFAILFVEPESRAGRSIARKLLSGGPLAEFPSAALGDYPENIRVAYLSARDREDALLAVGRDLIDHLAEDVSAEPPDHRVRKMIELAQRQIDGPISLADTAGVGGLSPSRLRHLFVENTGLPFRTYLLWLRLTRAVEAVAAGGAWTEAAHEAGFSDQAHLSRTFRRMFGVAPASLRIS